VIADAGTDISAAVPATIAALGSAAALIITALNRRTATVTEAKTDGQTETIEAVQAKVEENATKIAEVHDLTNQQLSDQTTRADGLQAENRQLRKDADDAGR
jgi:hypothetical protein